MIVRTALVTSSTIATLVGAQNLAMLDAVRFQQDIQQAPDTVAAVTTTLTDTGAVVNGIQHAAPSVVIVRGSGQANSSSQSSTANTQILPPNPSQISSPQTVTVQQPTSIFRSFPQRGRSSR
ncbi:MAG: hypothetical protein H6672_06335 [Anaerolineaceae bacterium]|nr:hypothetical protein [Anaerolineaceae bacterium]